MLALPTEFVDNATLEFHARAGDELFVSGSECVGLPIVLSGGLQIWLHHSSGRELLWYEVWPGDICIASLGALLAKQPHIAVAKAVSDSQIRILSQDRFQKLMGESQSFRDFVLATYVTSWQQGLNRIYEVAFFSVEQQIAQCLLASDGELKMSHQELSRRINSAREVVTRALDKMEIQGAIELRRGSIRIANRSRLRSVLDPFHG